MYILFRFKGKLFDVFTKSFTVYMDEIFHKKIDVVKEN